MEACGTGVVDGFHHREVVTDIVDIPRCVLRRPEIEVSKTCRGAKAMRIPIHTGSTNVEVAGMLDGVGERDLLARVLVEQMVGRIKRGFHGFPCFQIPFQSTGESIFTTKLIVSGTAFSCNAGGLRDDDVALLIGNLLADMHFHATGLLIVRTSPSGIFPAEGFGAEFISMGFAVVDHRNGIEHVVGSKPQVPRPHDGTILGDGYHGVTVFDVGGLHLELQVGFTAAALDGIGIEVYQVLLVFPNNPCTVDAAVGTAVGLLNPSVGDVGTGMVFKLMQNDIGIIIL